MFKRNKLAGVFFAALLPLAASSSASAQSAPSWPTRPITLIVSSAPGAGVDTFARILSEKLQPRLGQPIIVDNRPGASGMIAAKYVTRAPTDGYTFLLMPNTLVIAPYVLAKSASTVNVTTELAPVIMPVSTAMVLAVNSKFGEKNNINNVKDLVAFAKKDPGLVYSGGDNGSPMHILGEQFKKEAGLDLTQVPYNGVSKTVLATLSGQVNVVWMPTSGNTQYFKDHMLRALGTASPKRSAQMPDVPSMTELGYKDLKATAWFGILAPLGTPAAVVNKMNQEINAVLSAPDVKEKLDVLGYETEGGNPDALMSQMREDDARYKRLITDLKIKIE